MIVKCTLLFQQITGVLTDQQAIALGIDLNNRLAGWSESYYYDGPGGADLFARVTGQGLGAGTTSLCAARAALLGRRASIVGQRYQQLSPVGRSQSGAVRFPGSSGTAIDIPQMALLCKVPTQDGARIRLLTLRGIPDVRVVEGEYFSSQAFRSALLRFFQVLSAFSMRGKIPPTRSGTISSVNAQGRMVLNANRPLGLVNGDVINIGGMRTGVGFLDIPPGNYQINVTEPTLLPNQLDLVNWTWGLAIGGKFEQVEIEYPLLEGSLASVSRIVTRRVGRPFEQYRGRRSSRRRAARRV